MEPSPGRLTSPLRVVIAGAGNVASHLAEALHKSSVCDVAAIASRNPANAASVAARIGAEACSYSDLLTYRPDVVIVSVADRAMSDVVRQIGNAGNGVLALHTSGTLDKNSLEPISSHTGIFYPFQTFTKGFEVDMTEVPFFVETAFEADLSLAEELARSISEHVYPSDEQRRKHLHIAGVFTSNFVNVLLGVVEEELAAASYPAEVAVPLLHQTIEKASAIGSYAAQTGPAVRGDEDVMKSQEATLPEEYRSVYRVLSELIMKKHKIST